MPAGVQCFHKQRSEATCNIQTRTLNARRDCAAPSPLEGTEVAMGVCVGFLARGAASAVSDYVAAFFILWNRPGQANSRSEGMDRVLCVVQLTYSRFRLFGDQPVVVDGLHELFEHRVGLRSNTQHATCDVQHTTYSGRATADCTRCSSIQSCWLFCADRSALQCAPDQCCRSECLIM